MTTPPPTTEVSDHPNCEHPTPTKARIQGTIEFLESEGLTGYKERAFRFNDVSHTTGYRILAGNFRTLHNDSDRKETRGRKPIITPEQVREMEQILETKGLKGRALTWEQLGMKAGVEACDQTIKDTMGTMDYHKCIRGWQSPASAKNLVSYATIMLERYPEPENWERVRFSDEVHFGYGPQHHLRIIRKPGQRYCYDCIQHSDSSAAKDEKRLHG